MEIISKEHFIYKYSIKDYEKKIKWPLIEKIEKIPTNPYIDKNQKISSTDWNMPEKMDRQYIDFLKQFVLPDYINSTEKLWNAKLVIHNIWFQLYRQGDFHDWHTHSNANLTNIFYVKLPNEKLGTQFKMPGELIKIISVKEGDILTVPAYLAHRSQINETLHKKYVISFNSSIDI
jgi:hypothetical protein|tara:strand:- start:1193 stop:1720 length:528 start_codon:yes stop_codon:yes gene_type:complete